jgi:hypothetical protein
LKLVAVGSGWLVPRRGPAGQRRPHRGPGRAMAGG